MLCDIESLEEAVPYLCKRFDGVIRIEQGRDLWTKEEGFGEFHPLDLETALAQATPSDQTE